jgi:hypothetical protein
MLGVGRKAAVAAIVLEMAAFAYGYNPATRDISMPELPRDERFLITSEADVFPPNLSSLQQVRDVRAYDVLRAGEGHGPRWRVTYTGIEELPGAKPQPLPRNEPPPGVGIGLAISLAALAIEFFLHDRHTFG